MNQRVIQRVKGTQDFLDLKLFNFFINAAKKHLATYYFKEISTPVLEPLELFKRSLGLETDVVAKEMYIIKTNEEQEENICLRPEMTASTVRAFIDANIETVPWKVFSYGPVFRHERPQKGRFREFHQLTMETIGSKDISQDAQFIKMLDRFFHEILGLNNYALLINFLGCHEDRAKYREKLHEFLEKNKDKICSTCIVRKDKNIMRVFDCKTPSCQELYKNAPFIADNLCSVCAAEWQQVKNYLQELSVSFSYVPTLVRGLDYYNKTVFEFSSNVLGAQNAFCGGGRYDQLVSQLGGRQDQPSIGAAIGIERILLMLEQIVNNLPIAQEPKLHVILPLSQNQKSLALLLADELQAANLCAEIFLENDSVKSMMRKANKMGAAYAIILGEEEQANRQASVKNMVTGQETKVSQSELTSWLTQN
ncbi:histidine--tRNA ligase [Candidatus Dependentiae bacterium]|nr:histidine--tRNA ligase [Candidatus Dependentiae bacterium]